MRPQVELAGQRGQQVSQQASQLASQLGETKLESEADPLEHWAGVHLYCLGSGSSGNSRTTASGQSLGPLLFSGAPGPDKWHHLAAQIAE